MLVEYKNIVGIGMALLCIAGLIQVCPTASKASSQADVSKAKAVVQVLEKRNVHDIEDKIQVVQNSFHKKKINTASFPARFSHTIIMGDSMAEGLLEYGLLPESIVIAKRGRRTDNIDGEINSVIAIAPKAVFLQYGLNDLEYCRGKASRFAAQYKVQIEKIQKALPNTKIYINSITPIAAKAQSKKKAYTHVSEFNEALKKLCEELQVVYIDNTNTIDFSGNVYEKDGIHPTFAYYPLWLSNMLEHAGL